jgi:hypothetical protein
MTYYINESIDYTSFLLSNPNTWRKISLFHFHLPSNIMINIYFVLMFLCYEIMDMMTNILLFLGEGLIRILLLYFETKGRGCEDNDWMKCFKIGSYEHGNECTHSIKDGEILTSRVISVS